MQPETPPPPTPSTLRVAVLIAMPSPALHGHHESAGSCSGEQESIPHVEFGVVDVCVGESAGGERQKRSSEESGVSEV